MVTFKLISLLAILSTILVLQSCGKKTHDDNPEPQRVTEDLQDPENDKELRLRGYDELSSIVEASFMSTSGSFSFQKYLGGGVSFFSGAVGLSPLMGYYSADPVNPGWRNVTPNSVSTATYIVAFSDLASDLEAYCDPTYLNSHVAIPKEQYKNILIKYCTNPNLTKDEFKRIWLGFTANLVPAQEFEPWLTMVESVKDQSSKDRFHTLVTTAMESPWLIFNN